MRNLTKMLILAAVVLAGAAYAAAPASSQAELHFGLAKSLPEAEASVEPVSEIRLWFTEVPAEGTVSIRLVDGSEEAVHTGDLAQDEEDEKVFYVATHHPLESGTYTVAWRGMGADGHVVRESFWFSVQ